MVLRGGEKGNSSEFPAFPFCLLSALAWVLEKPETQEHQQAEMIGGLQVHDVKVRMTTRSFWCPWKGSSGFTYYCFSHHQYDVNIVKGNNGLVFSRKWFDHVDHLQAS